MYFINDFEIGHTLKTDIKITKKLHDSFMEISRDNSPIHTSYEFAKKSNFQKPIGYAFLITTLLSGIYGKIFPGGSELCLTQTCNFKNVYYIDDVLTFSLKVKHKNISLKLVTIEVEVLNQDKDLLFTGESLMKLSLGKS